jgi:hypothetical protein
MLVVYSLSLAVSFVLVLASLVFVFRNISLAKSSLVNRIVMVGSAVLFIIYFQCSLYDLCPTASYDIVVAASEAKALLLCLV